MTQCSWYYACTVPWLSNVMARCSATARMPAGISTVPPQCGGVDARLRRLLDHPADQQGQFQGAVDDQHAMGG